MASGSKLLYMEPGILASEAFLYRLLF